MNGTPKFTPGPWSVPHFALPQDRECKDLLTGKPSRPCQCGYVLCEHYMGAVATVHFRKDEPNDDNPPREEAEANARLIAAAPDLYDALRAIADWCQTYNKGGSGEFINPPTPQMMDRARAVLAAAVPTSTEK